MEIVGCAGALFFMSGLSLCLTFLALGRVPQHCLHDGMFFLWWIFGCCGGDAYYIIWGCFLSGVL